MFQASSGQGKSKSIRTQISVLDILVILWTSGPTPQVTSSAARICTSGPVSCDVKDKC